MKRSLAEELAELASTGPAPGALQTLALLQTPLILEPSISISAPILFHAVHYSSQSYAVINKVTCGSLDSI